MVTTSLDAKTVQDSKERTRADKGEFPRYPNSVASLAYNRVTYIRWGVT